MNDDFFSESYEFSLPESKHSNLNRKDYSDNTPSTNIYEDEWS